VSEGQEIPGTSGAMPSSLVQVESETLRRALRKFGLGGIAIANLAAKHRAMVDPDGRRNPPISHDTVSRFLRGASITRSRLRILQRLLPFLDGTPLGAAPDPTPESAAPTGINSLFPALIDYFKVTETRLKQCRADIAGTYTFHANSEDRADYPDHWLVRGAMKFYHDEKSGELRVEELQRSVEPAVTNVANRAFRFDETQTHVTDEGHSVIVNVERWAGHYILRQGKVIVILRNIENIPKFYILDAVPYGEQNPTTVTAMWGIMVKAGTGRPFTSQVQLNRNSDAFKIANLVRASETSQHIVQSITRPPKWIDHPPRGPRGRSRTGR